LKVYWKRLAATDIAETEDIICLAETLNKVGIKPLDALHVACAVAGACDFFITT